MGCVWSCHWCQQLFPDPAPKERWGIDPNFEPFCLQVDPKTVSFMEDHD